MVWSCNFGHTYVFVIPCHTRVLTIFLLLTIGFSQSYSKRERESMFGSRGGTGGPDPPPPEKSQKYKVS